MTNPRLDEKGEKTATAKEAKSDFLKELASFIEKKTDINKLHSNLTFQINQTEEALEKAFAAAKLWLNENANLNLMIAFANFLIKNYQKNNAHFTEMIHFLIDKFKKETQVPITELYIIFLTLCLELNHETIAVLSKKLIRIDEDINDKSALINPEINAACQYLINNKILINDKNICADTIFKIWFKTLVDSNLSILVIQLAITQYTSLNDEMRSQFDIAFWMNALDKILQHPRKAWIFPIIVIPLFESAKIFIQKKTQTSGEYAEKILGVILFLAHNNNSTLLLNQVRISMISLLLKKDYQLPQKEYVAKLNEVLSQMHWESCKDLNKKDSFHFLTVLARYANKTQDYKIILFAQQNIPFFVEHLRDLISSQEWDLARPLLIMIYQNHLIHLFSPATTVLSLGKINTLLGAIAAAGRDDLIHLLYNNCETPEHKNELTALSKAGYSPLSFAVQHGRVSTFHLLWEKGHRTLENDSVSEKLTVHKMFDEFEKNRCRLADYYQMAELIARKFPAELQRNSVKGFAQISSNHPLFFAIQTPAIRKKMTLENAIRHQLLENKTLIAILSGEETLPGSLYENDFRNAVSVRNFMIQRIDVLESLIRPESQFLLVSENFYVEFIHFRMKRNSEYECYQREDLPSIVIQDPKVVITAIKQFAAFVQTYYQTSTFSKEYPDQKSLEIIYDPDLVQDITPKSPTQNNSVLVAKFTSFHSPRENKADVALANIPVTYRTSR